MVGQITVPGPNNTNVTVAAASNSPDDLAQLITNALILSSVGGTLQQATPATVGGAIPPDTVPAGDQASLYLDGTGPGSVNVPTGYNYVYNLSNFLTSITGSDVAIVTGTAGGAFQVSGTSSVAAADGANTVSGADNYTIATGDGDDVVFALGQGFVSTGGGSNIVVSSAAGGVNQISSTGLSDLIVAVQGSTSINSTGDGVQILGSGGDFTATLTGFNPTIAAGTSSATIDASAGSSDPLIFGGNQTLDFIGGAAIPTIIGGVGGTEQISVGAGGLQFSANQSNASTIVGADTGMTTLFGGSDTSITFTGTGPGGFVFVAGLGNETLDASGYTPPPSTGAGTFQLGADSAGQNLAVGGVEDDTFAVGSGADTITGGGGADTIAFFSSSTSGGHDYTTDWNTDYTLAIIGYDTAQSASTLVNNAQIGPGGVTLTLSDSTQITFTNLTDPTPLYGKILYSS